MRSIAVGLIGIGIFAHFTFRSILYFLKEMLQDLLLYFELDSFTVLGVLEGFDLIIYLMLFIILIKWVISLNLESGLSIQRNFLFIIIAFVAASLLEFATPFITHLYRGAEGLITIGAYFDDLNERPQLRTTIESGTWFLRTAVVATIIFIEIYPTLKKVKD